MYESPLASTPYLFCLLKARRNQENEMLFDGIVAGWSIGILEEKAKVKGSLGAKPGTKVHVLPDSFGAPHSSRLSTSAAS
jgi:hypothetical protein